MDFDLGFDGKLLEDLYAMLDPRLSSLTDAKDPACPEEFPWFDSIEHIYGVAAVAAQRYITVTCQWLKVDQKIGLALGPNVGETTKVAALWAAANFWKHSGDGEGKIHLSTQRTLEAAGVSFDHSIYDQTKYMVGYVFQLCDYLTLVCIFADLKKWTTLVIEQTGTDATE